MSDINDSLATADAVTSSENTENSTQPQTADATLESTFDDLIKQWQGTDTEEQDEDLAGQESVSTSDKEDVSQSQPVEEPTEPATVTTQEAPAAADSQNYQQLYDQLLREKEIQQQQMGLLYNRLNELSTQYQSLKEDNTKQTKKPEATNPAEVQELYEFYPDIAKAVEKMIETRTSTTQKSIEEATDTKALRMQQQVQALQQQQFVQQIMAVHPDLPQLMQNRVLNTWVQGLDPVQRAGANWIMQYGTSNDIVDLVNRYKDSTKTNSQEPDSTLVNKVKSAMSVPSNKQEPTVPRNSKPKEPVYDNVDDAFKDLVKQYEKSGSY